MSARPRSTRRMSCSPCAALGLLMCLPLLAVPLLDTDPAAESKPNARATPGCADELAQEDPLRGLWMRYETRGEGDPLRFWYFHGDGKGLYRYGKVGLANTHSFDYTVTGEGEQLGLQLHFRKRGEEHSITALIEQDDRGRSWLTLRGDPREPGARYYKLESQLDFAALAHPEGAAASSGIGDRIWIDYRNFATGGSEFHMYQLAATAIDGRGVGWFHRGDFDDWSTESLTYRLDGERIELFFDIREEPNSTVFQVIEGDDGRELLLEHDPRDFWAVHRYKDGGRSFSSAFDVVVGLQRFLAGEQTAVADQQ